MKTESTNEQDPLGSGVMSNDLIKALIDNYRQNQMNAINETMGITDSNSIWFDLPKLKRFISQIEHEGKKIHPECAEEDLGIRFYYAAYPKIENWDIMESHPVPQEYSERHTLVMVPTLKKESEDGEVVHFDFNSIPGKDKEPRNLSLSAKGIHPPKGIGENQGTLSPPASSTGMF
ncbi:MULTISPECIES: hypothetical protein [unclassified Chryseobacterium]|uniref:hypothetical protein n=1 Tax=unclassified Chryseobacterium TaxID=2593645 RepID=UPI00100B72F1|nr:MULTISPECIES: hypothetical protein [unclassified Chryseobacterium]RXM49843.1 hypothetical protein BOQ64_21425 [Chryseobacterium sp. CH25]RXM61991.1 hypothetical protein BOQ60_22200 [Chryseobacterium sp. CH1]